MTKDIPAQAAKELAALRSEPQTPTMTNIDAQLQGTRPDNPLEAIRKLISLFDDEGNLTASFEQIQMAVLNGSDILSHFAMAKPRFFIDHGMIHDRVTGKHITTDGEPPFEDGIEASLRAAKRACCHPR